MTAISHTIYVCNNCEEQIEKDCRTANNNEMVCVYPDHSKSYHFHDSCWRGIPKELLFDILEIPIMKVAI